MKYVFFIKATKTIQAHMKKNNKARYNTTKQKQHDKTKQQNRNHKKHKKNSTNIHKSTINQDTSRKQLKVWRSKQKNIAA